MPHVDGVLLARSPDELRLLLGHSAAVVRTDDIESVEVLDTVPLASGLMAVRVHYRNELVATTDAGPPPVGGPPVGVVPFAMATRREPAHLFDCPRYQEQERRFLDRAGLTVPGNPGRR